MRRARGAPCRSPFTARDFRAWGGSVTAARTLLEAVDDEARPDLRAADAAAKRTVMRVLQEWVDA